MDKSKQLFEKLADAFSKTNITEDDFIRAYQKMVKRLEAGEGAVAETVEKMTEYIAQTIKDIRDENMVSAKALSSEQKKAIDAVVKSMTEGFTSKDALIAELKDMIESKREYMDEDRVSILEEVKTLIPVIKDPVPETGDQVVEKINTASKQILRNKVEGLEDAIRMAAANSVSALPPTTTSFYNSGKLVGRAKNLNVVAGTPAVSINGDTAILNLAATVSGVATVNSGTDITVDNTDPSNPVINFTGSSSGITRSVNVISTPTTAGATAATDYVYLVSGTTTLTLPTAVSNTNRYTVKNVGVATVTIATTSAQTIDGSASATLPVANTSIDLISNGSNWVVV